MDAASTLPSTTGRVPESRETPLRHPFPRGSVAIYEDIVPHYRVGIFEALAKRIGEYTLYAERFDAFPAGVRCIQCAGIGVRNVRLHLRPLSAALRREHNIIICEGRLKLVTSTLLAFLGGAIGVRVLWWSPIWRPNGRVEIGNGIRGWLMRRVLRSLFGYVTYGTKAAAVAREGGMRADRIFVAYNSLDTQALELAERRWRASPGRLSRFLDSTELAEKRVVLFVGQFIKRKKLETLLEAFSLLRHQDAQDELRLVLIGDGPELASIRSKAAEAKVSDAVIFAGRIVDMEQACPFFLAAKVLVLPGAGGLVVNQGFTHGVPAIVGGGDGTEVDCIREGINGHLWTGESPASLADLVRRITYAPNPQWQEFSAHAREVVQDRTNMKAMLDGMVSALVSASMACGHE